MANTAFRSYEFIQIPGAITYNSTIINTEMECLAECATHSFTTCMGFGMYQGICSIYTSATLQTLDYSVINFFGDSVVRQRRCTPGKIHITLNRILDI